MRTLNLAFNSIEYLSNLFSSSIEVFNVSSNKIRYLNDYFASNLRSIRIMDFDSNRNLGFISLNAFCFINTLTVERLSFRFTNLSTLNQFDQFLCSLVDNKI